MSTSAISGTRFDLARRSELVLQLRDTAIYWVTAKLNDTLAHLDGALFELAVNAPGAGEQNLHFNAMQELRARREEFVVTVQGELARRVVAVLDGGVALRHAVQPSRAASDWVAALRDAQARTLEAHEGVLTGLAGLLNGLLGTRRFDGAQANLSGPELLGACLAEAAARLELPQAIHAVVTQHCERGLFAELDELCSLCAGVLLDAGVEADSNERQPVCDEAAAQRCERALRRLLPAAPSPEQTQQMVRQVFGMLEQDARFSTPVRILLASLLPCADQSAREDPAFLGKAGHPLRLAVAGFAALATGMAESEATPSDPWFAALQRCAAALLAARGDSARSEQAALELAAFATREQHRARLAQRRTEEAEQARALAATARAAIERVIARELGAQRLPAAAEELLRDGWQRILAHAWLRGGVGGDEWRTALAGLTRFMALWRTGAACLPDALAAQLHDGMLHAGCDPLRIEILLRSVEEELASWDPPAPPVLGLVLVCEDEAAEAVERVPAPQLGEVDALARGTWLQFATGVARASRGRLALRLEEPARLLFVDRHGQRVACLGREDVARLLAQGRAAVLEGRDPLDLALTRALERLQLRREHAA